MDRRTFLSAACAAANLVSSSCGPQQGRAFQLALNWKPDPQFGGFYAADYAKHGLKVDLLPGGAGTPTVQMVGAGSAQFGIVSADEIVLARARGNDVVALFAAFQDCPQGIMVHAERGMRNIGDVTKGGTLAIQKGLPYARLLEKRFGFSHVRVVPSPGGDLSGFLGDKDFAQQCFVVSEPLAARKRGNAVQVFPVGDIGYNPYTTVLAISGENLRQQPELAKKMVDAVREGWQEYLKSPSAVNAKMHGLNPSMDLATFAEVAEAQKRYIEGFGQHNGQLGAMTAERWTTLSRQLLELGDVPKEIRAEDCFRNL